MALAKDMLALRRNQTSSVETLLAALDWAHAASATHYATARAYAAAQAAEVVLYNVTIHALEALEEKPVRSTRRASGSARRTRRRFEAVAASNQRRLFA
jgi:hypothetical protein